MLLLPRVDLGDLGGQRRRITEIVVVIDVVVLVTILAVFPGALPRVDVRNRDWNSSPFF